MLGFLDSIYPFIASIIFLFAVGLFFSAVIFFGIKGVEIGNFEPKEKSVENLLKFFKKNYVRIISVFLIVSLFIAGITRVSFRNGTINEIQKMYNQNDYFILEFQKSNIDNLQLDFTTLSLVSAVRGSWISKNDSISFIIGNKENQFRIKLKNSVNDSLMYYVFIENYNYTSYEPYATIKKLK